MTATSKNAQRSALLQTLTPSIRNPTFLGDPVSGGDSRAVCDKLTDIQGIQSAFAYADALCCCCLLGGAGLCSMLSWYTCA